MTDEQIAESQSQYLFFADYQHLVLGLGDSLHERRKSRQDCRDRWHTGSICGRQFFSFRAKVPRKTSFGLSDLTESCLPWRRIVELKSKKKKGPGNIPGPRLE